MSPPSRAPGATSALQSLIDRRQGHDEANEHESHYRKRSGEARHSRLKMRDRRGGNADNCWRSFASSTARARGCNRRAHGAPKQSRSAFSQFTASVVGLLRSDDTFTFPCVTRATLLLSLVSQG